MGTDPCYRSEGVRQSSRLAVTGRFAKDCGDAIEGSTHRQGCRGWKRRLKAYGGSEPHDRPTLQGVLRQRPPSTVMAAHPATHDDLRSGPRVASRPSVGLPFVPPSSRCKGFRARRTRVAIGTSTCPDNAAPPTPTVMAVHAATHDHRPFGPRVSSRPSIGLPFVPASPRCKGFRARPTAPPRGRFSRPPGFARSRAGRRPAG